MEYENKNCLVTGGAGFIGSHLVESLTSLGANVRVIDDLSVGNTNVSLLQKLGAELIVADISSLDKINNLFVDIDIVFHLAAMNRAQRSIIDPIRSNEININGTLNCLKSAEENNVTRFVFISSSSVYKGISNDLLKENMFLEPLHPYGIGKLAGEHYCRIFNDIYGLETTVLRYFSVFGPRQRGDIEHAGVIAKFIRLCSRGEDLTIFGSGNQKRNFSYVSDVVGATLKAGASSRTIGKVINVASEKEYKVKDIAQNLIKTSKSSSKIVFLEPLKGDPPRNPADVSLAKELINFKASHTFEEGLEKTFRYYKDNKGNEGNYDK